jgi:Fe-S cluster biogenesis protein NfuA
MKYKDAKCDICGFKAENNIVGVHYYNACIGCIINLVTNAVRFQKFVKDRKELEL